MKNLTQKLDLKKFSLSGWEFGRCQVFNFFEFVHSNWSRE